MNLPQADSISLSTTPDPSDTPSRIASWAQLVRLPNVFTVVADVSAAFLLVAHGPSPPARLICVVLAGVMLYWAGMILNDVFDVQRDREERPTRPIPAGLISISQATIAGWSMLFLGVFLAALSGFLPGLEVPSTWLPAAIGTALAVMIVAYDGPLKKTMAAPVAMGSCRVLSFLLGASACLDSEAVPLIPRYVLGIAIGFGVYITGITTMARGEATGGRSANLPVGLVVTAIGISVLALAPQLGPETMSWKVPPDRVFPLLIGLISLPVVLRAARAVRDPTPRNIQMTIRVGILGLIPLAASFAFLGAGPKWGLAVFLLAVPAIVLGVRFRVT